MTALHRLLPLLVLGAVLHAPAGASQTVIRLTGDPWPPYVIGNLGLDAEGGLGVELIRAIFSRIDGVEVQFPLMPWKRALREVELGNSDGIALLLRTEERERYMAYSDPVLAARSLIWYRQDRFPGGLKWQQIGDLLAHNVGVIRGYSYGAEIDEAVRRQHARVTEVSSVQQLFQMLAGGRVELALANDAVGLAMARRLQERAHIVAASKPTGQDVYHIGLSRRSGASDWLPQVNRAILELRRDGTLDRIRGRFFARDGVPQEPAR